MRTHYQGGCGLKEGGVSHLDPDPQIISVECEKKEKIQKKIVIFHTTDIGVERAIEDSAHCGRWCQGRSGRWCFSQHLVGEWRLGCPA